MDGKEMARRQAKDEAELVAFYQAFAVGDIILPVAQREECLRLAGLKIASNSGNPEDILRYETLLSELLTTLRAQYPHLQFDDL